jgi:hypothetical protein
MAPDPSADDWRTPAEVSDYRTTPDLAETLTYLRRLAAAHPERLKLETFGRTGEGRELAVAIASRDGVFDPAAVHASGRVVLLVQNAIHAGEMDGKDACLALLRDLLTTADGARLLERVVLVVLPVYNADGHERRSKYNRLNQLGPEEMGWRANATNLNLNRDYMKADAPETRAFLGLFHRWQPDFFVDDHVTDGADFQYDVTFILDATPNVAPGTAAWIRETVTPELVRRVDGAGHLAFPGPVFLEDDSDPAKGLAFAENPPRFSTGYMILEGRPGLLVELHMLKDYRTRVGGNLALLRGLLEILNRDADRLIELNRAADRAACALGTSTEPFPLVVTASGETTPVPFRGFRYVRALSDVSGAMAVRYEPVPWETTLPMRTGVRTEVSITPPAAYLVPPEWVRVLEVLLAHGVRLDRLPRPWTGPIERYRLTGMEWPGAPFEGRHPILRGGPVDRDVGHFGTVERSTETATFPAGSALLRLDQPRARFVIHWLEPEAPDSAFRWGFFDAVMEQKEFGEAYVLERVAREELARDPELRATFETKVHTDPAFAASPGRRLGYFFDRSPWGAANRVGVYPVGRLRSLDGLPIGPT